MTLVGICPKCGFEGALKPAPTYKLGVEHECPNCTHLFTAGGE